MINEWINIKDAVLVDDVQQVHCDTRDFHVLLKTEPIDESEMNKLPWWEVRNDSRFLIPQEEIIDFLLKLEKITGGVGSWRMMNFRNIKAGNGWFKYVRLYRVSPTYFIITDGTYAANRSQMNESNLDTKYIYFEK